VAILSDTFKSSYHAFVAVFAGAVAVISSLIPYPFVTLGCLLFAWQSGYAAITKGGKGAKFFGTIGISLAVGGSIILAIFIALDLGLKHMQ